MVLHPSKATSCLSSVENRLGQRVFFGGFPSRTGQGGGPRRLLLGVLRRTLLGVSRICSFPVKSDWRVPISTGGGVLTCWTRRRIARLLPFQLQLDFSKATPTAGSAPQKQCYTLCKLSPVAQASEGFR